MSGDVGQLFEAYHDSLVRMLWRRTGDRDRAEDIAVADEADAGARPADLPDQVLVAVAVEDAHDEVFHVSPKSFGHVAHVLRRARVDVNDVGGLRADGEDAIAKNRDRARLIAGESFIHREHNGIGKENVCGGGHLDSFQMFLSRSRLWLTAQFGAYSGAPPYGRTVCCISSGVIRMIWTSCFSGPG